MPKIGFEFKEWKRWVAVTAWVWFFTYGYLTAMQNVRSENARSQPNSEKNQPNQSTRLADLPFDPVINQSLSRLRKDYSDSSSDSSPGSSKDRKEVSRQMSLIAMRYENADKFPSSEGVLLQSLEMDSREPSTAELACRDLNNLSVVESLQAQVTTNSIERQLHFANSQHYMKLAEDRLQPMIAANCESVPRIEQLLKANQRAVDLQIRLDSHWH